MERCVIGIAYQMMLALQGNYDAEECRGGKEAVPKLVPLGAGDAGLNRGTSRADGPSFPDGRGSSRGDSDPLGSRSDDRFHRATQ
jgi:hypothetical protein